MLTEGTWWRGASSRVGVGVGSAGAQPTSVQCGKKGRLRLWKPGQREERFFDLCAPFWSSLKLSRKSRILEDSGSWGLGVLVPWGKEPFPALPRSFLVCFPDACSAPATPAPDPQPLSGPELLVTCPAVVLPLPSRMWPAAKRSRVDMRKRLLQAGGNQGSLGSHKTRSLLNGGSEYLGTLSASEEAQ